MLPIHHVLSKPEVGVHFYVDMTWNDEKQIVSLNFGYRPAHKSCWIPKVDMLE